MKPLSLTFICLIFSHPSFGQSGGPSSHDRIISFPDIPGYQTLLCDLHQHTVFSDGSVWPTIRVQEALKDGLDAIAVTEHLEYQPHKEDIPHPDRNRAYEIESKSASNTELLIIKGSEITRDMPPGHSNAIFLQDANALLKDDYLEVFREAKRQQAFVFWNHPHWHAQTPSAMVELTDVHRQLISEGLLHGIEVVNEHTYSEEALQICLDNDLTILGTSDIHGLIDWDYQVPLGGHRPVTLAFAREKTLSSLKEALFEGRTAVWFHNDLIGKDEFMKPLIEACLSIEEASYLNNSSVLSLQIANNSDVNFMLENLSDYTLHANSHIFTVPPHETTKILVKTRETLSGEFSLKLKVLNAITAPKTHPEIELKVQIAEQ